MADKTEENSQLPLPSQEDGTSPKPEDEMGNCLKSVKMDLTPKIDYSLEKSVVHDTFLKSGKIAKSLIITYPDKQVRVWGPPDFQPPKRTINNILNAIEGKTSALAEEGINLGEENKIYVPAKCEAGVSIYATSPSGGGCIIYKTPMSLIVAVYTADQNPSAANRLVVETADVMAEEELKNGRKVIDETKEPSNEEKPVQKKYPKKKSEKKKDKQAEKLAEVDEEEIEFAKSIVKDTLMKPGRLTKALMFDYDDKIILHAEPADFKPPDQTITYIVQALNGNTMGLAENGVDLGEEDKKVYVPGKVEDDAIVCVYPGGGGCVIYKTEQYGLIGVYSATQNPSMANRLLFEISDELKGQGL